MWSYICYSQVLLILTYVIQKTYSNEKNNKFKEEAIFTDIIKNISRVNNVLQELITNYEQLQKIYYSEENVGKDFTTDTEIDEVFRNVNNVKKKKGRSMINSKEKSKESYFPATEIYWSGIDEINDHTLEESVEELNNESKQNTLKVDSLQMEIKSFTGKKSKPIQSKSIKSINNKIRNQSKRGETHNKNLQKQKQNLMTNKKETHSAGLTKQSNKTRYRKVIKENSSSRNKKINNNNNIKPEYALGHKNIPKNIKKVVFEETFSPKTIWDEIIQNKPIQLQPHKEGIYGKNQQEDLNKLDPNLRTLNGKTALVILTKNKKTEVKDLTESTEDESVTKEIIKTSMLRQAYGDACLKVVVKKCHKACKLVNKAVCSHYSCKSKLKQKFIELSKTGCIREFRATPNTNKIISPRSRDMDSEYIDATRMGYLALCQMNSHLEHETPILRNKTKSLRPNAKHENEINILRDRYEKACSRVSAGKCFSACKYAAKSTCDTFVCTKGLKKSYKKYCKKQCRKAYKAERKSSSESDFSRNTDSFSGTIDSIQK